QRVIEPTGRRGSGRRLARGHSHPSSHLQETEIRGAASLDGGLERAVAGRSFQGHAEGRCGSLYWQSTADGAFHRATQSPAQEAAHLSHHGLSSRVCHSRERQSGPGSSFTVAPHTVLATSN